MIKIHSFELTLLSFRKLEEWVFAEVDELKEKRKYLLDAGKSLVKILLNGGDAGMLADLRESLKYPGQMNTEQISARLLLKSPVTPGLKRERDIWVIALLITAVSGKNVSRMIFVVWMRNDCLLMKK